MSTKNSSITIGYRTRDLPTCSAVSQPTATPRALFLSCIYFDDAGRCSGGYSPACRRGVLSPIPARYSSRVLADRADTVAGFCCGTAVSAGSVLLPVLCAHLLTSTLSYYSGTSANEDNSLRNHIRLPKRDFPWVSIENRLIRSGCCPLFKDKFYQIVKSTL